MEYDNNLAAMLEQFIVEKLNEPDTRKVHAVGSIGFLGTVGSVFLYDIDFLKRCAELGGKTFSEMLLQLIDESGEKSSSIYFRANIDRRHFSKICNHKHYRPSKQTVLAFAIALKLDFDKTQNLLATAGLLSVTPCSAILSFRFLSSTRFTTWTWSINSSTNTINLCSVGNLSLNKRPFRLKIFLYLAHKRGSPS